MTDSQVANGYVSTTPGFRRGEPHITGRHISVEFIADLYVNHGLTAGDIASNQDLALAQVHAALAYYYDHPEEIEAIWREQEKPSTDDLEGYGEQARLEAQLKKRHPDRYKMLMRLRAEDPQREMTVPEIAAEFKLTEQAIRKAAKNQSVPAHKVGRDWVIQRIDALAYWGGQRRTSAKANVSAHP